MFDEARMIIEFLYSEDGQGLPKSLKIPTVESVKEDLLKYANMSVCLSLLRVEVCCACLAVYMSVCQYVWLSTFLPLLVVIPFQLRCYSCGPAMDFVSGCQNIC